MVKRIVPLRTAILVLFAKPHLAQTVIPPPVPRSQATPGTVRQRSEVPSMAGVDPDVQPLATIGRMRTILDGSSSPPSIPIWLTSRKKR